MRHLLLAVLSLLLPASVCLGGQPGDILRSFPATDLPTGLAWDGEHLWLADRDADWLYAIDPSSGARVDSLPCPAFSPTGLACGDGCLWVSGYYDENIYKVSLDSRRVIDVIGAPSSEAYGLAWFADGLWAVDASAGEIVSLDTQDGTTLSSIKSPSRTAHGLAAGETCLWVSDRRNDKIYRVEPEKGWVVMAFDTPGPYCRGLAWDGGRLWAVDYQTDSLYALSVETDRAPILDSPKRARVKLTCKVRCEGPDPMETCDVYLALPHDDLPHQRLLSEVTFQPATYDLTEDRWGQRFVHFTLTDIDPGETAKASYELEVEISNLYQHVLPEHTGGLREIPRDLVRRYTVDGARLMLSDPVIRDAVADAVGDETNPYWIVRRIFHYVNDHIEYERVGGWDTAPNVLRRGTGSCSEYSFVFMAMARAAGIPTRFCAGVVERGDEASMDDVFHRWTEVYLPNYGWVPVDTSAGDDEWQADAMKALWSYSNRFLITTVGGGDSEYVGWGYNYGSKYNYKGRTSVDASVYADWDPIE
jgi:hypothetical protein